MSSVTPVPETRTTTGRKLGAETAWKTARDHRRAICVEGFVRFRYGDGFSHSRALGLQLALAFLPLMLALVGLSDTLHTERVGMVLRITMLSLTPGASDPVIRDALDHSARGEGDGPEVALWLGLIVALISLTTAMGQVERGANRIYGIQRDRPTADKYGRAVLMALTCGMATLAGFVVLIAGPTFGEAVEQVYGLDADLVTAIALPVGVVLLLAAVTAMLRFAPVAVSPAGPGCPWAQRPRCCCGCSSPCWWVPTSSFRTVWVPRTGH
ncbi:YhjD/YihY/BrkB family envelope integrity protein (plasmid) [Rhodococcus opacus]